MKTASVELARKVQTLGIWADRIPDSDDVIVSLASRTGHTEGVRIRWLSGNPESPAPPPVYCYKPDAMEPMFSVATNSKALLCQPCVFKPRLSDLLEALSHKGQPHLWLYDSSEAGSPIGWHCEVGIHQESSFPQCDVIHWIGGDCDTPEDAVARCLLAVVEAEAARNRVLSAVVESARKG